MVKAAAPATQMILATQSSRLVDEFTADQVMIVERDDKRPRTLFRRLDEEGLSEWLERYCLSELWEKNVLEGAHNADTTSHNRRRTDRGTVYKRGTAMAKAFGFDKYVEFFETGGQSS